MEQSDIDDCKRIKIHVPKVGNIYLIIGIDFCLGTIPFENRPESRTTRLTVDAICEAISEELHERETSGDIFIEAGKDSTAWHVGEIHEPSEEISAGQTLLRTIRESISSGVQDNGKEADKTTAT